MHDKEYYHVTLRSNLDSIREKGLMPQIGYFSSIYGETEAAIYVFPTKPQLEDALASWLGEAYEDYCEEFNIDFDELELIICVINMPDEITVFGDASFYEQCIYETIKPEHISYYDELWQKIC